MPAWFLRLKKFYARHPRKMLAALMLLPFFLTFWFCLPRPLFNKPYSTVLYCADGNLLNARVAADGQWRFPLPDSIPDKYIQALITFEDRYFYYHPGFNPFALLRAGRQNLKAGKTLSGGSTLSMQLIRLASPEAKRSVRQKIREIILAVRLEIRYSKAEILKLYAAHAPYGGNVVGLEAASWRYFDHGQKDLSWAEAATLAILPNSPALIFPGRNQQRLLQKRNKLLQKLHHHGHLDSLSLVLAQAEPLPGAPHPLPQQAYHLFDKAIREGLAGKRIHSTIRLPLQQNIAQIMQRHHQMLAANHIQNMAVLVLELGSGQVLAYQGNSPRYGPSIPGIHVDIIESRRSPGSLLKPLLFAGMLDEGSILPGMLVPDIPTRFQGFSPQNFNPGFDGAVPANRALARSLNIPAVRMLQDYRQEKFHHLIKQLGINTYTEPPSHYGLSVILGGGEINVWEIANAYHALATKLRNYNPQGNSATKLLYPGMHYALMDHRQEKRISDIPLSAATIWHTFEAMIEAARPDTDAFWKNFASSRRIAWKTGTSYGFRDAWALGLTRDHLVVVWVGNATGEGRPGLTGVSAAAPIMFEVFGLLPAAHWFEIPYEDMIQVAICAQSGHLASPICNPIDTLWIPIRAQEASICPYHQWVHLDETERFRVSADCHSLDRMKRKAWFVLPPLQEYYYKNANPYYQVLPPLAINCNPLQGENPMQWIYPVDRPQIFIPIELDGTPGETVFRLAHRQAETEVYWHLNETYLGTTRQFHEMALRPQPGQHRITAVDANGHTISTSFKVITRR